MKQTHSADYLEKIRKKSGPEGLKTYFLQLAQQNGEQAAAQINAERLKFPTLYHLIPEIDELNLYPALNQRNRIAFSLSARILSGLQVRNNIYKQAAARAEDVKDALRWVFLTGAKDDGVSGEFDEALDNAASLLIRTYGDMTILPQLVRLIFKRNRQGAYIHDLVWALFSSRDPESLRLIVRHLQSKNTADKKLARKLLSAASGISGEEPPRDSLYSGWYKENAPYLCFTGEGFHKTSDPTLCGIDLGAKFLCKKLSPQSGEPLVALAAEENSRLAEFQVLEQTDKKILAGYSHRLFTRNKQQWGKWMKRPLAEQLAIARRQTGGAR